MAPNFKDATIHKKNDLINELMIVIPNILQINNYITTLQYLYKKIFGNVDVPGKIVTFGSHFKFNLKKVKS